MDTSTSNTEVTYAKKMNYNTLFFMVSTGGSILEGRRGSDQTYRYVGGITREWETEMRNIRNVWALKEVVRRLNGGDPDIKIFFKVVNDDSLRLLRPVQTHVDASALVDIAMDVPFTKTYGIPTKEVANQLNAVRQLEYEVVDGYVSDDNVHK